MVCIAFFVCLVILIRRRREGLTIAMPAAVMGLGVVRGLLLLMTIVQLIAVFKTLGNVQAEDKATILAAGISEAMKYAGFGIMLELPVLVAAWAADHQLRKRQRQRRPDARPAPDGSRCATHPEAVATLICGRCGGFLCAACAATDGSLCAPCLARTAISPSVPRMPP